MVNNSDAFDFSGIDGWTSPDGYNVDMSGIWRNDTNTEAITKEIPELKGTSRTVTDSNGDTTTFYSDADYYADVKEKNKQQYTEDYIAEQVELAVEATNAERRKRGLAELEYDASLDELAQTRADEIVDKFSHTRPDGTQVTIYHLGENIAFSPYLQSDQGEDAIERWMNSPGHKANILNKNYTRINIKATVTTEYGAPTWFWVQLFGM